MNNIEMEFILKTLGLIGTVHLIVFSTIAFLLKGIYQNTQDIKVDTALSNKTSSANEKRIDKLDSDTAEISRSLHDFRSDIGARVGHLEYRVTENKHRN